MPSIYRKTPKGQAEIETRANKLVPRLRTALIMVDGKRSDAELRPLLMQDSAETLASLLEQGFIEVVGGAMAKPASAPVLSPSPATPPGPAPAPKAVAATGADPAPAAPATAPQAMRPMPIPLATLQRDAVRLLTDQVGPMAESVAIRIERARSTDELRAAVLLAAQVIANTRGRQAAESYVAHFADL